jgi:hypothetical protein
VDYYQNSKKHYEALIIGLISFLFTAICGSIIIASIENLPHFHFFVLVLIGIISFGVSIICFIYFLLMGGF